MSIDIGCRESYTTLWQLTSARCELRSTVGKLTPTVCHFTATRIQLQRAGEIVRGRMSIDIGLLRIDIDPAATNIGPVRIPATRRHLASPYCQLTSTRCKQPLGRLPVVPRPCHLTPARSVGPVVRDDRRMAFPHSHLQKEDSYAWAAVRADPRAPSPDRENWLHRQLTHTLRRESETGPSRARSHC